MLTSIKKKFYEHIVRKGFTVGEFTAIVDRNRDKEISLSEFVAQVKDFLPDHEAVELFRAIDHDGNNSLTSDEINYELAGVNAAMIIDKVKKAAKT